MDNKDKPQDGALFVTGTSAATPSSRDHDVDDEGKAEEAAELLDEILELMDLDVDVDVRSEDEEEIILDITGRDAGRAIGKKGATLDSLQFLLNKILNRQVEGRRHLVVDSGDYRERHENGLVTLAKREAKRAVQEGRTITLQPMSARDRRVVHLSLAKLEDVTTMSQGEGTQRRIQIIPQRQGGGGGARRRG